jgi:hypothetical protein
MSKSFEKGVFYNESNLQLHIKEPVTLDILPNQSKRTIVQAKVVNRPISTLVVFLRSPIEDWGRP